MGRSETRRINPLANITIVAVLIVLVFECLVIFGALELKAQSVAKYAPWAYEPFLRLVGEHPDSPPRWAAVEEPEAVDSSATSLAAVTGLEPSVIPVLIETNETLLSTNVVLEATTPAEVEPEPVPVLQPALKPEEKSPEIVPVG